MEAARLSGAGHLKVMIVQVAPYMVEQCLVYLTILCARSLVFAAGLSFLGLGIAPPHPEWGRILTDLKDSIYTNPWLPLGPGLAILATSTSLNVLGAALRDVFGLEPVQQ
jgi:peptide/nickel transport system permease protein